MLSAVVSWEKLEERPGEAIAALENDRVLLDAVAPALAGSYLAIRRADRGPFSDRGIAFGLKRHFYKY